MYSLAANIKEVTSLYTCFAHHAVDHLRRVQHRSVLTRPTRGVGAGRDRGSIPTSKSEGIIPTLLFALNCVQNYSITFNFSSFPFKKWTNNSQIYCMQCSVYSLFVVYTLWDLLFVFKMNSKCSRRSQLEHLKFLDAQVGFLCSLKYSKTIRRPGLCSGPHWGSSQRSPDPSWRAGVGCPSLKTEPLLRPFGV